MDYVKVTAAFVDEVIMLVYLVFLGFLRLRSSLIAIVMFGPAIVLADVSDFRRMALVIGNSQYEYVSNIPNSANDARDIAAALGRISFNVTELYDLDYRQMRLALRDFSDKAATADVVLVYFAGHGIEIDNTNYLIPTNAELKSDKDVEFEAIRLDSVLNSVSTAKGLKLVLIDACRNNPFLSDMERTTATRSIGRGLSSIDPGGVLVGYSARGGTLALDGKGRNSPYAEALLEHIEVPGLELGKLFRKVRDSVFKLTDGYQEPFTYGSLPGRDIFLVPAAAKVPSILKETPAPVAESSPEDEREKSAQRVLREALKLDDQTVKLGALKMIAQLYPNTRAGQYAADVADVLSRSQPIKNNASVPTESAAASQSPINTTNQENVAGQQPDPALVAEKDLNLSQNDYRNIQRGLNFLGYSAGPVDGIFGTRSRAALKQFQSKSGSTRTGYLTAQSLAVLKNVAKPPPSAHSEEQTSGETLAALPKTTQTGAVANSYHGDYSIVVRRRPNPNYNDPELAKDRPKIVLQMVYRKSSAGFQMISAQDLTEGGENRPKRFRASLSEKGRLRISGNTGYLFGKVRIVPFSITQRIPADFSKGQTLHSNQGQFDEAFFMDVTITKR